ncbi:hypothetical protein TRFO_40005 [Tritrichomonas foetus]|uniref:Uncharacterized protein n=1 Tax=Tritrichomonas foetus TaxID=1144522 RepID=A0A1J4J916_9EUKA|nr:hypothetical protein TRFO_40005 [Tritrichomonas foetus]|eukprot:OHS93716.1 hypothetical protein TRFO_40005 [Tritrichomonas foetus]
MKFQIKPVNFDIQGKKSFLTEMEQFGEVYKIKFSQEAIFVYFFNSESALDLMGKKAHGEIFQDLNVSFDLVSCLTIFNFQFDIKFPEVEEYLKNGKIDFLYIKENYRIINLWPSYNIIIRNEEKNKCLQYVKNTPNKITQPFIMPTYDFDSIKHKFASFLNTNTAEISMDEEDSIQNNIGFFPKIVMFQKNPETQKIYISFEDDQSLDVFLQMYSQSAHIFDPKSQNPVLSSPNRQRLNIIYKNAQQTLNNPSESNKDPYNVKSNQSKIPSEQCDQRTTQQNPPENKSKVAINKQTAIEKHSNNQIRHQETNNHTGIHEKIFVQSAKGGLLFTPPNASSKLTFTPPGGKPPTSIRTTILNPHDYNRK